ncbi:MEL-28 protein, partial [Aphelenchoides avenae]
MPLGVPLSKKDGYDRGGFLTEGGIETKYYWTSLAGKISVWQYDRGPANVQLLFEYAFGPVATVIDAAFFRLNDVTEGVLIALRDPQQERYKNQIAFIPFRTRRCAVCVYLNHEITHLLPIADGCAEEAKAGFSPVLREWPHLILVGCRTGFAGITHLGISEISVHHEDVREPVKPSKLVPLSRIFMPDDRSFRFLSDDGGEHHTTRDDVYVTALSYIERGSMVVVGFNFGGVLLVSLKTQKVYTFLFAEGLVNYFAVQLPEDDPRPIAYFWVGVDAHKRGQCLLMLLVSFPEDDQLKDPSQWTYKSPAFTPQLKWQPDRCTKLICMKTVYQDRRKRSDEEASNEDSIKSSALLERAYDTSLMLIVWLEVTKKNTRLHGSLFDLNAFYYKRFPTRVTVDNTIAKQLHFFSRFSSDPDFTLNPRSFLDFIVPWVERFAKPPTLSDTIDQLFYASTFNMSILAIGNRKFSEIRVNSLQLQLVNHITENIVTYFESPSLAAQYIYAIGLANSLPAKNLNEERACVLRTLLNCYFGGVIRLLNSTELDAEAWKAIQRWIWKEVEQTKAKLDEMSEPLFDAMSELPLANRSFIFHAAQLLLRARDVFTALYQKADQSEHDEQWKVDLEGFLKATTDMALYACAVSFAVRFELLPLTPRMEELSAQARETVRERRLRAERNRQSLDIFKMIDEMMHLNPDNECWQGKVRGDQWYPPEDFSDLLQLLLLFNVSKLAKVSVLVYYCKDLEQLSDLDIHQKLSEKCKSYLMQEELSVEIIRSIDALYHDDIIKSEKSKVIASGLVPAIIFVISGGHCADAHFWSRATTNPGRPGLLAADDGRRNCACKGSIRSAGPRQTPLEPERHRAVQVQPHRGDGGPAPRRAGVRPREPPPVCRRAQALPVGVPRSATVPAGDSGTLPGAAHAEFAEEPSRGALWRSAGESADCHAYRCSRTPVAADDHLHRPSASVEPSRLQRQPRRVSHVLRGHDPASCHAQSRTATLHLQHACGSCSNHPAHSSGSSLTAEHSTRAVPGGRRPRECHAQEGPGEDPACDEHSAREQEASEPDPHPSGARPRRAGDSGARGDATSNVDSEDRREEIPPRCQPSTRQGTDSLFRGPRRDAAHSQPQGEGYAGRAGHVADGVRSGLVGRVVDGQRAARGRPVADAKLPDHPTQGGPRARRERHAFDLRASCLL